MLLIVEGSAVEDCWCDGGIRGYSQHTQRKNKTTPCAETRAANAAAQRDYVARRPRVVTGWIPGSDIDLDEDDPL